MIHTRLPEISPIVKATCEEFGYRYTNFPDFWTAIKSHIQMLHNYGRDEDEEVHVKAE